MKTTPRIPVVHVLAHFCFDPNDLRKIHAVFCFDKRVYDSQKYTTMNLLVSIPESTTLTA